MDRPREGLDPLIWVPDEDGSYVLSDEARTKIRAVVAWIIREFGLDEFRAHLTGSITSNQWKEDSDLDVHVGAPQVTEETQEDMNRDLRSRFQALSEGDPEAVKVGGHPIEVYFQANPFQDMMSVGCYDIADDRWIVGPEMKDLDYDPVSDFWDEDMDFVEDVVKDARKIVLKTYENAVAYESSNDPGFRAERFDDILGQLEDAKETYDKLREFRKISSAPEDETDAERLRDSRRWKVADSAFKILDRLGYLRIFKLFSQCFDMRDDVTDENIVGTVLDALNDNLARNRTLSERDLGLLPHAETEPDVDESAEQVEEGLGSRLATAGIAMLLSIPGIFGADQIEKGLKEVPADKMHVQSKEVQNALKDVAKGTKKGGLLPFQAINLVARTLYAEGQGEDSDDRKAIMSVIANRTGNDVTHVKAVLSEPGAFSCWRGVLDWDNITYTIPKSAVVNPKDKAIWDECLKIAKDFYEGRFKSTIGNRNSYMNKKTASPENVRAWGGKLDLRSGRHHFGYLREHDPKYVFPGTMTPRPRAKKKTKTTPSSGTYTVVKGDTLSKIAKSRKTTIEDLMSKNPDLKNPNSLKIG